MRDIDEDSDIEDRKKRGKGRETSDSDEDSDFQDIKKRRKRRGMKRVTLKTSRRLERGEK